ncbi:hypothetical protein K8I61_04765 [bacterium]|nr:hypothetical protein [bacterium]
MQLILVIGRDPEIGKAVQSALDSGWYRVWTSPDPGNAISMIGQQEPCVVVMDARLEPDVALRFLFRLKNEFGQGHLTALLVTHAQQILPAELAAAAQPDDTISWPASLPALSNKLRLLIDRYETKKARAGHYLDVASPDRDPSILKSDSQYDSVHPREDDHGGKRNLYVAGEESGVHPSRAAIELPKDFFGSDSGIEFESQHTGGDEDISNFAMNTMGQAGAGARGTIDAALAGLTPDHIDKIAREMLDEKLTRAARENIRRVIAKQVQVELEALLPTIIANVKEQIEKS